MTRATHFLDKRLYQYVLAHEPPEHPVLAELRAVTQTLPRGRMQVAPEQGPLLAFLLRLIDARRVLELGTFTGYSSICIARGLRADGRLLCLDASEKWTAIARRYWKRAGVRKRIELRLGPAIATLKKLDRGLVFDFAFIDAAKEEYDAYYELILPRVRPNGLILFDNMLWGGRLGTTRTNQASGRAIDKLNLKLARDKRVESVLLPIADGLQLCRKR